MASQTNFFAENFLARDDLTGMMSRFVAIDSTGRVYLAGASSYAEGILENDPPQNMPAEVSFVGITKLSVDSRYAIGTYLAPTTDGQGTQALAGGYQYIRAKLIETSLANGDIVTVRLIDDVAGAAATGTSGYSGATGATGASGYSGIGTSGYSGIGTSGYSGIGTSGYSGIGTSGYSGVP